MDFAYDYTTAWGLCADAEYPYVGVDGVCTGGGAAAGVAQCRPVATTSGVTLVLPRSDPHLAAAVMSSGPVTVPLEASLDFQVCPT